MVTEYKLIVQGDPASLVYHVNALILAGWEPQGGVCWNMNHSVYVQAMVKVSK